jgi:hypothetical protein
MIWLWLYLGIGAGMAISALMEADAYVGGLLQWETWAGAALTVPLWPWALYRWWRFERC